MNAIHAAEASKWVITFNAFFKYFGAISFGGANTGRNLMAACVNT